MLSATWVTLENSLAVQTVPSLSLAPALRGLNSNDLFVGNSGTGILDISNGGSVSNGTGQMGYLFGADGTATIDGSGSTWTNNGFFYVGGEQGGNGVLNIAN